METRARLMLQHSQRVLAMNLRLLRSGLAAAFLAGFGLSAASAQPARFICSADEYNRPANCISTSGVPVSVPPSVATSFQPPPYRQVYRKRRPIYRQVAYQQPVYQQLIYQQPAYAQAYPGYYPQAYSQPYAQPAYYPQYPQPAYQSSCSPCGQYQQPVYQQPSYQSACSSCCGGSGGGSGGGLLGGVFNIFGRSSSCGYTPSYTAAPATPCSTPAYTQCPQMAVMPQTASYSYQQPVQSYQSYYVAPRRMRTRVKLPRCRTMNGVRWCR
jgi:hypothetical protein